LNLETKLHAHVGADSYPLRAEIAPPSSDRTLLKFHQGVQRAARYKAGSDISEFAVLRYDRRKSPFDTARGIVRCLHLSCVLWKFLQVGGPSAPSAGAAVLGVATYNIIATDLWALIGTSRCCRQCRESPTSIGSWINFPRSVAVSPLAVRRPRQAQSAVQPRRGCRSWPRRMRRIFRRFFVLRWPVGVLPGAATWTSLMTSRAHFRSPAPMFSNMHDSPATLACLSPASGQVCGRIRRRQPRETAFDVFARIPHATSPAAVLFFGGRRSWRRCCTTRLRETCCKESSLISDPALPSQIWGISV